jgi:hypothetical protein
MAHPGVIRGNNILDAAYEITGADWIRDREPDQTSTGTSDSMVAYVVRHKANITLLGLFVAKDIDALWDLVDEFCDPSDYEYRSVENGALILPQNELDLDFSKRADEVEPAPAEHSIEMSGDLLDAVLEAGSWLPFDTADVGSGPVARLLGQEAAQRPVRSSRGRKKI